MSQSTVHAIRAATDDGDSTARLSPLSSPYDDLNQRIIRLLREDGVIYGVTTGYGDSCTVNIPPANTHSRMYTSRRPWIRVNMNRNADCGTVVSEPPAPSGRSAVRLSAAAFTPVSMTPLFARGAARVDRARDNTSQWCDGTWRCQPVAPL